MPACKGAMAGTAYESLYNELDNIKLAQGVDLRAQVDADLNAGTQGLYGYLAAIEPRDALVYGMVIAASAWGLSRLRFSGPGLLGLAAGAVAVYLWHERSRTRSSGANRDLLFKLRTLDAVTAASHAYLYTEARLINLFAMFVDLRQHAPKLYDASLQHANELLRVKEEATVAGGNCARDLEVVRDLASASLNSLWGVARSLPNAPPLRHRLDVAVKTLQDVLVSLVEGMASGCAGGVSPWDGPQPLGTHAEQLPY